MNIIQNYVFETLQSLINEGGEAVEIEEYNKRKAICLKCSFYGEVKIDLPTMTLKLDGCTICGCPTATKAKLKTIKRLSNKKEEPITGSELIQKALNMGEFELVLITCPHPEGDKWA